MSDFQAVLEHFAEPWLVLDDKLALVCANAAWRERFMGTASAGAPLPANGAVAAVVAHLRASRVPLSRVFRLDLALADSRDGGRRYWRMHASPLPADGDRAALMALRFEDVTAQLDAGETERREKAKLRSYARLGEILARQTGTKTAATRSTLNGNIDPTLALAELGVWQIDLASGSVECNDRCLRDLALEPLADAKRFGEAVQLSAANLQRVQAGESFESELRVDHADGPHWVLVRGSGSAQDDGLTGRVGGITLDITSRKKHELELSALADKERDAREQSEALARAMDEFVAAVSHELRSPLNAIISWGELLRLSSDPAAVTKAGDAIRRNGRQLSLMVDDLLDSGAIASGKLSVQLQPLDLGALATLAAEDVRKQAERKNLTLDASQVSSCTVMADEGRIRQVIWNLLSNAIKFTEAGGVRIALAADGSAARLSVEDTGRGIPAAQLPQIFGRFVQIDARSSGRAGGLGLGLWLVKHIVELHGGTVSVTSEGAGHGSTFTVTLPLLA
ncbi:sensor histidine kinase [Paraburkholderia acidisoli]|uniref:sensor histidine kinase n=1 Tax=Paraburkholderia acidisoli TaxID=2571748 RepID=UPI001E4E874D|nr:HAMP domain-containing sensor histidine kinase [Paraburkholderia acidisoli]